MTDTADWLRMYAQQLEDQHAPQNLTIGMRQAADQLDASRETTLQLLGQIGQLSEELEREKREAERAQDAHGVRFLNYLEETARLTDRIEVKPRIKREVWVNVYRQDDGYEFATYHDNAIDADNESGDAIIARVRLTIDCEEGEGL